MKMKTNSATVSSPQFQPQVIIIGAGITGLVLAQCLKKNSIPSTVFERDPDPDFRGRGWGLTIHWSLSKFLALLPQHLIDRLPEVYVNPEASEAGENGNFLFFDLQSGEAKWKVPPSQRIRVSRERLRALLLDGVDVQWSKTLTSFAPTPQANSITAAFSDGTTTSGTLLIGADGHHSRVRALLLSHSQLPPSLAKNKPLPFRLLGASVIYPTSFAQKLRDLDPFFFQGGDPTADTFLYFSFLDTPSSYARRNGHREESYECQIIISWPYRSGWRGGGGQDEEARAPPHDVPETHAERVRLMKCIARTWAEPFRELVDRIPEDTTEVKAITLEDWVPKRGLWDNQRGQVTMVGDAAHAMTMYRGEGANHGIADISTLTSSLLPVLQQQNREAAGAAGLKVAIDAYEAEMIARTGPAVLTSRRACADAHEYRRINDQSPLVSRRVMVTEE